MVQDTRKIQILYIQIPVNSKKKQQTKFEKCALLKNLKTNDFPIS